jgi:uracil-DNA glycosylase family protein
MVDRQRNRDTGAATTSAADFLPPERNLTSLRQAATGCRGCGLWEDATQTVFGVGLRRAEMMLVGEQPGDREDREGKPFVGPAGAVLDRALAEAGIERGSAYVTNAVKHFKWRPRGRRRLHQTPRAGEIDACRPWLDAELEVVQPRALIALGATAGKALFGPKIRVMRDRGRRLETAEAEFGVVTIHPSAVLRVKEQTEREEAFSALAGDLAFVAAELRRGADRA